MNMLDRIIERKKEEVAQRKLAMPVSTLEQQPFFTRTVISFSKAIINPAKQGIVAEFKRQSPSRGIINNKAAVETVTKSYAAGGASALSILTDTDFFGGSLADLQQARSLTIPLLRKDFMIDEYQLLESKAAGADVILLIAACLTPETVHTLARRARSLGLEVLLEIHDESELAHVCDEVDVVGINNRDLKTFTVNIERSIRLAEALPAALPRIAESGIQDVETIFRMRAAGFQGFLIGEQFMKDADPGDAFATFIGQLKRQTV